MAHQSITLTIFRPRAEPGVDWLTAFTTLETERLVSEPGVTRLLDAITIETITGVTIILRNLTDAMLLSDRRISELGKLIGDPTLMADARFSLLEKLEVERLRLTDVSAMLDRMKLLLEVVALRDARLSEIGLLGADRAAMADARFSDLLKIATDRVELSDIIQILKETIRELTDAVVLVDARLSELGKNLGDPTVMVDARSSDLQKTIADAVRELTDIVQAIKEANRTLTDNLLFTDRRVSELGKLVGDSASVADVRSSDLQKLFVDVLRPLTDAISAVKELAKIFSEALALSDARMSELGKQTGDTTLLVDARFSTLDRLFADAVRPLTDAVTTLRFVLQSLTDALALQDRRFSSLAAFSTEQAALADARLLELAFTRADSVRLLEASALDRALFFAEAQQQLVDQRFMLLEFLFAESRMPLLSVIDIFSTAVPPPQLFERLLTDSMQLVDVLVDAAWAQYRNVPGRVATSILPAQGDVVTEPGVIGSGRRTMLRSDGIETEID